MASYSEATKPAEYIAVATMEAPADDAPPIVGVSTCKGKKMNKMKKKKRCLFMCCSNMQFENEEEREKALACLNNENSKLAMVMCCSNFQVGPKDEFGPDLKPAK